MSFNSSSPETSDDSISQNFNQDLNGSRFSRVEFAENTVDVVEDRLASTALNDMNNMILSEQSSAQDSPHRSKNGSLSANFAFERSAASSSALLPEEATENARGDTLWRSNSELEADGVASPSSSGYAGERGSSSNASDTHEPENYGEIRLTGHGDAAGAGVPDVSCVPEVEYDGEDERSESWRKKKKHFLILSHSGKPIYTRYGDEHKLAGFSATLQAIMSFIENGGDRLKLVRAGQHQIVFLVKGPIYLVCISCTEEPCESLKDQLEILYGQMILILTKSVNRSFEKNPKFDMAPLLGGTQTVFSNLIYSFGWNPATFLHAYTCLPLGYTRRQALASVLQDVTESGVLFAILMCGYKVVSLVGAQRACLHPDDMLLLFNFVISSDSFRMSESFSPICLPRYNPMAFMYAYVHFFNDHTYLMLFTSRSDAFHHLKNCRIQIETILLRANILSEIQRCRLHGGLRVVDLPTDSYQTMEIKGILACTGGPAGLWHFIYRSTYLDQYVSSEFSPPLCSFRQQKSLYRAYKKLYASMHDRTCGPHKTQFRRDENYAILCWIAADFELYATFSPLADMALAVKICNSICQWVRNLENDIFMLGVSPFSW